MFADRIERVRSRMQELEVDTLLLSVGPELPYLTGYEAMPLERLTMLVLPAEGDATLVVPELEAPRVVERPDVFSLRPWGETEDPVAIVARLVGSAPSLAIGDRTWARFLVDLQDVLDGRAWRRAVDVVGPVRAIKDDAEIEALRSAGAAADRVARQLQAGDIPLRGRTEAEVSADIGRRLIAEGHHRVNFAIVAAGPNASSPHHEPGDHVIEDGEAVLCDFGGTMHGPGGVGYCSDMTRVVGVGSVPDDLLHAYESLHAAQRAARRPAVEAGGDQLEVPARAAAALPAAVRVVTAAVGMGPLAAHAAGLTGLTGSLGPRRHRPCPERRPAPISSSAKSRARSRLPASVKCLPSV